MNKKWFFIELLVILVGFNSFSLSLCSASGFLTNNSTQVFVKMEPAILGVYTKGNEVAVLLNCEELTSTLTQVTGTIQFSNLTFKKVYVGAMFDSKDTELKLKSSENNVDISISGKGKPATISNTNTLAVFIFEAIKTGTARFWFKNGKIINGKNEILKHFFLPSSFKIVEPRGISISLNVGEKEYYIDEKKEYFSQKPVIFKNRTLVPLRSIAEKMGAKVEWIQKSKKIVISLNDIQVEMKIGNILVLINGQSRYLDVPPLIIKSSTFIPLRYIAETLGGKVTWNDETQKIEIFF
ncbi:MAG: copper amine oxidase N-terminal domain-containing protein [Caldisericia bacterium]|nr:copper amine oxidase N-terminal domain-containing protein [Caldisericia bacterium]